MAEDKLTLLDLAEDLVDELKHREKVKSLHFKLASIQRALDVLPMIERRLKEEDARLRQENF